MKYLTFFVAGVPVPKGSAKAYVNKHTGRAQVMQDNRDKQKPWASSISYTAMQEMKFEKPAAGPFHIDLHFVMPRLKSHFGTGKKADVLRDDASEFHVSKPDLDKLVRCVKDALTGVVWNDDSQVCTMTASKTYGVRPGVSIAVKRL